MKTRKQLTYTLLVIFGIIILINIISGSLYKRFDTTQNEDYTMSKATKNILRNLTEPVTITAYFTKDLPPQYSKVRKDFKDVVEEYSSISKGMVVYEFIDPGDDQQLEQAAMQDGVRPVLINVRAKDKVEQQKAYIGAVIKVGTQKESIPIIQEGTALEYTLSTAIKKLTITEKPYIGFVQGHGEATMQSLSQTLNEISFLYTIEPVTLNTETDLLKYKTLVITKATQQYTDEELAMLDHYLAGGGKLMLNIEHITADLQQTMQITATGTGLEGWLAKYGVMIEDNAVIDKKCGNIGVQQQQGSFNMTIPIAFPYMPIVSNFADHPITEKLQGILLMFPASIAYTGIDGKEFTPILMSSETSGTQTLPAYITLQKKWNSSDYPISNITLGGILTGSFNNGPQTSIVIIGDGDYAVSQGQQRINPDNINLFANSIDWLSDDTGLIELRSKGLSYRPLDELEDGRKAFLKWMNFLLPIAIIIVVGLIIMQHKRNKRIKRMEEHYVK
ncbi:MAG: Gldg family protein [Bacteroidales bacterium]|nr:Gldg family protein [Bacteroidales bacterium]MDD2204454.1 Gldg family protein [Bacteroidales bacterium]MDD3151957.1 Gldg family protein [Bacteroidales bacterium]MDD3913960.1 Gldg family protein [Bacteroidales bacterium]MDD4633752.1 Gldg family protein [Bacteroidales bacterium]